MSSSIAIGLSVTMTLSTRQNKTPAIVAGVLFCTALSVEDTLRPIAIQSNKHYLSADFETNKMFCNDATKAQGGVGG